MDLNVPPCAWSYPAGWNSRARYRSSFLSGFQRFLDRKEVTMPAGKKELHHPGLTGWMRGNFISNNHSSQRPCSRHSGSSPTATQPGRILPFLPKAASISLQN
jgi:hypothetical protein